MDNLRKIQLTGSSTLAVSLPKEWAKRYGIAKGAQLSVSEASDGSLIFSPSKAKKKHAEALLEVSEKDGFEEVRRKFLALYLAGFNTIKVQSKESRFPPETRKTLLAEIRRLIGLETTEELPNKIAVQDFFSHENLSVTKTLSRTHLLSSALYEDLNRALDENDAKLAESVVSRDDEVDRLRFLLLRQLNLALQDASLLKKIGLNTSQCISYATIARSMERIADKLNKIATLYLQSKPPAHILKSVNALNKEIFQAYLSSVKAFEEGDSKTANAVMEKKAQLMNKRDDLEKQLLKKSAPFECGIILDNVAGIADDVAEIAETTIDDVANP